MCRFCQPTDDKYSGYIKYIDRDQAVRNMHYEEYSTYTDYMGNPKKTGGLFSANQDVLSSDQVEALKKCFSKAQTAGSMMWQNVISYDNRWLMRYGIYDPESGYLDETRVYLATRQMMAAMSKKEHMDNLVWSAAIHYNTDNIHVHIAAVELPPTRTRGKLKLKTIEEMKSRVLSAIVDRSEEYAKLSDLVRQTIVGSKREHILYRDRNRALRVMFNDLLSLLPQNRRLWQYNNKLLSTECRNKIDEISKLYLDTYHKKDYQEFTQRVAAQANLVREAYGEGKQNLYLRFVEGRVNDLYSRLGNAILREAHEIAWVGTERNSIGRQHYTPLPSSYSSDDLRRVLHKAMQRNELNMQYYERFIQKRENEK